MWYVREEGRLAGVFMNLRVRLILYYCVYRDN